MNAGLKLASLRWSALLLLGAAAWQATPAWAADPGPTCGAGELGEKVLELFPPSPPDARAQSARRLGECKAARAVGVLATVLRTDDDLEARTEAIRALGAIGTPEARKVLQDSTSQDLPAALRAELARALEKRPLKVEPPSPPQVIAVLPPREGPRRAHVPPPAPAPEVPFEQQDGLGLALATSAVAGGTLMPFLAALADQTNPLALTLTGGAGAIIGGGSAWGLSRFGMRPTLAQSAWYTNVTAWGTLSGLSLYSGLFSSALDPSVQNKALWGLLAGGETLGLAAGIWSAQRWTWTPRELVLANGLVLGSALTYGGARLLGNETVNVTPPAALATIPVMVAAAAASRYANPTSADVQWVSAATLGAGWTGFLLGNGAFSSAPTDRQRLGGLLLGLGGGFLSSAGASVLSEVEPARSWASLGFSWRAMASGWARRWSRTRSMRLAPSMATIGCWARPWEGWRSEPPRSRPGPTWSLETRRRRWPSRARRTGA